MKSNVQNSHYNIDHQSASTGLDWMLQDAQVTDEALIRALMHDYFPGILRLAGFITGNSETASEAADRTLLYLVTSRHHYWGQPTLKAWIYGQVVRNCRNMPRRPQGLPLSKVSRETEAAGTLFDSVRRMDDRQQLLLLLRYVYALSIQDICYVVGSSEDAIHDQLLDLRRRLLVEQGGRALEDLAMAHQTFYRLVHASADGMLSPEAALNLRQHIDDCTDCRDYAAALGELGDKLALHLPEFWPEPELSSEDQHHILANMMEQVSTHGRRIGYSSRVKEFAIIGVVIAIFILIIWFARLLAPDNTVSAAVHVETVQSTQIMWIPITVTPVPAGQAIPAPGRASGGSHDVSSGAWRRGLYRGYVPVPPGVTNLYTYSH